MRVKAVLFDLDGTLVDSNEAHVEAWAEAFRRKGVAVERQAIHGQIGKGADHLVPSLVPDADAELRSRLDAVQGEVFKREHLERIRPFPGACELLRRMHDTGRKVVLASSASQAELEVYLERLGARGFVAATTSADDVEATKPSPDIFAAALAKIAPVTAGEALVVGDSPYDVQAAQGCGMSAIAVRSGGFPNEALTDAGAVALYDDVAALLGDFDHSPLSG